MSDNALVKLKTGTIARLEEKQNGQPVVTLQEGTVYFAVDLTDPNHPKGRIVYDAPYGNNGVMRVVMSTDAEIADRATVADLASQATILANPRSIDGVNFDGSSDIIHYGTCSTAGATAAKQVTCANFSALAAGSRIIVTFTYANTASNPTLNVSGSGAKAIYHKDTNISPSALTANGTYEFIYDGNNH